MKGRTTLSFVRKKTILQEPDMALLKKTNPQLLGIGIDEETCLVVNQSRAEIWWTTLANMQPAPLVAKSNRRISFV